MCIIVAAVKSHNEKLGFWFFCNDINLKSSKKIYILLLEMLAQYET